MLKAEKKDGLIVDFDKSKIVAALGKAGLEAAEAENIAGQVEAWAETAAVDGVIKTSDIREKLLQLIPPEAAEKYKSSEVAKE